MKKILLSAFGLDPHRGSDAEVGWKWTTLLAESGYEVWVITREINRACIESELAQQRDRHNLHFIYYEIKILERLLKTRYNKLVDYLNYDLWQCGAYRKVRKIHKKIKFDVVHHITWVSARQPSFMGNLGIPFYFGPVAGGERAPWRLRRGYGLRQWTADILRDVANLAVKADPLMWMTFRQAERIYVTSEQTCRLLPRPFQEKARIQLAIGTNWSRGTDSQVPQFEPASDCKSLRILYVGRFIGWKGMHIGFHAFKEFLKRDPSALLTMVGRGPDEKVWRSLVCSLSIGERVKWVQWVDRQELQRVYASHDLFLYPSLHDSGGLVVLEALSHGLPVVCLDLGGPGVIVDDTCGLIVGTKKRTQNDVVEHVADSLLKLAHDAELRKRLSKGAVKRVRSFSWERLITQIYNEDM